MFAIIYYEVEKEERITYNWQRIEAACHKFNNVYMKQ